MPKVLVGHGWESSDRPWTFLPAGMKMSFFAREGEELGALQGELILSRGNFGDPYETYGKDSEADWIPNYNMAALNSAEIQRDLTVVANEDEVLWLGDKLPGSTSLCTGGDACLNAGAHSCDGILGHSEVKDEKDIVFLACRIVDGASYQRTRDLGPNTESSVVGEKEQLADRLQGLIGSDDAAAGQLWDSLEMRDQALLMNYPNIQAWSYVREARPFALSDPEAFYRQVQGMVRDRTDPDAVSAYYADPQLAGILAGVEGIGTAFDEMGQGPVPPSADQLAALADINARAVKDTGDGESVGYLVGGWVLLIGDGHDPVHVAWVQSQADCAGGTIEVEKGGVFGAGSVTVYGCPPAHQGLVQDAIGGFSKKEVTFA